MNQVLLVGDETARYEVDFVPYGLACHSVKDAKDAVDELKNAMARQQPWTSIVVSSALPDMTGPAFVDGLMRHFNPETVVLVADVEPHIAQHLQGSPKVQIFAARTDGSVIADHLFKRLGRAGSIGPGGAGGFAAPPSTSVMGSLPTSGTGASLAALFDPQHTPVVAGQHTPHQAFTMPSPAASLNPATPPSAWSPPMNANVGRPSTMPFLQALTNQPQAQHTQQLMQELTTANAELASLRAQLAAASDQARDAHAELNFVKQAAQANLADDAEQRAQFDQLAQLLDATAMERDAAREQLVQLSTERDEAIAERQQLTAEREKLTAERDQLAAERDQLTAERDQQRQQLTDATADLEQQRALSESLEIQVATLSQTSSELKAAQALISERDIALDALKQEKVESEAAWAQEQQRTNALETTLAEAQASLVDAQQAAETAQAENATMRAALTEAESLGQQALDEQRAAFEEKRAATQQVQQLQEQLDRATQDATAMRQMLEQHAHEQARVVGEIEQLRPIAAEVDRSRAALVDMQHQLEAALGTDEADGDTQKAIEEAVRARTREIMELARAIEPFSWGLDQAASFFADASVDGAQRHVQSLRLLQKTLERLKNELDRLHH